jgi:site-specific recombinase XerD
MTPANKGQKYPADALTTDEARALIRAASGTSSLALRNTAMLVTMYRAALRAAEVLALRPHDVDPAAGTIRVRNGKGGRSRMVALDDEAALRLGWWAERRKALKLDPQAPLFCSLKGRPLPTSYLRKLVPRLARQAGIERRVHPHALRHTCAFEMVEEGIGVHAIKDALGHSSLATTDRYLRHLNPRQLLDTMRARTWTLDESEQRGEAASPATPRR